ASRAIFRASHAGVWLVEGDSFACRTTSPSRIPLDADTVSAEALRTRRVVVVNRFAKSRWADGELARQYRPAAVLVAPLADGEGGLGVLPVGDVTHAHRFGPTDEEDAGLLAAIATVALRKDLLVQELMHASAAKSEFLASVSHDLRTPL